MEMTWIFQLSSGWIFSLAAVNDCVPKIEIKSANSASWIDAEVLKSVRKKERLKTEAGQNSSTEYH